jgi:hypothetical protein
MTLPNGVTAAYAYDGNSRITGISYSFGGNQIGNLTYAYDTLNRRATVGGSLALTGLPSALIAAAYDAANQITTWNGTAVSYDANGQMINDGQNSYSWDARRRLTGIAGPLNGSFAYDAFGRRTAKTAGNGTTGFFYNGESITQELSGSTVTANIWSAGAGFIQRTDASGSVVPLTDAMGSVRIPAKAISVPA